LRRHLLAASSREVDRMADLRLDPYGGRLRALDNRPVPAGRLADGDRTGKTAGDSWTLFQDSESYLRFRVLRYRRSHPGAGTPGVAADLRAHHSSPDLACRQRSPGARGELRRRVPGLPCGDMVLK